MSHSKKGTFHNVEPEAGYHLGEAFEMLPRLCWVNFDSEEVELVRPFDGDVHELAFGSINGEMYAALFVGEGSRPIFIPKDVIDIASTQGWNFEGDDPASQSHIDCDCRSCDCGGAMLY